MVTPTTHDLSFQDERSVRVSLPLLSPRSNFPSASQSSFDASSVCITKPLGCSSNHLLTLTWTHSTSGKVAPFNLPATASPVDCCHQLLVLLSSNIALK